MTTGVVPVTATLVCLWPLFQGTTSPANAGARFTPYDTLENIRDANLDDKVGPGTPYGIVVGPGIGEIDKFAHERTANDRLREYGCAADAVVVAVPREGKPDFTPKGTFIFTQFWLDIALVLKGDEASASCGNRSRVISSSRWRKDRLQPIAVKLDVFYSLVGVLIAQPHDLSITIRQSISSATLTQNDASQRLFPARTSSTFRSRRLVRHQRNALPSTLHGRSLAVASQPPALCVCSLAARSDVRPV